jgi:hypothetical protein
MARLRIVDDLIEEAHATLVANQFADGDVGTFTPTVTVVHRDTKPENMPVAKARPREPEKVLGEAMRGGRRGR